MCRNTPGWNALKIPLYCYETLLFVNVVSEKADVETHEARPGLVLYESKTVWDSGPYLSLLEPCAHN